MLNTAQFNKILYNGKLTRNLLYKISGFTFSQYGFVSKILSAPYNMAVLVYNKVRVFINSPKTIIRTKIKWY